MAQNNILIALNTVYHVEVALSLYVSIKNLGFNPTIFVMRPDVAKYNLTHYLFNKNIDFITDYTPGLGKLFNKVIIVSAYPTIERPDSIPLIDHPLFNEYKQENIILISHRANMDKNKGNIICVTPLAEKYGLDYIYLCENPSVSAQIAAMYPVTFLIQGNFYANRRDLKLLDYFLRNTEVDHNFYKFILIGNNKDKPLFDEDNHPSVFHYINLSEEKFYDTINNCDYILPLISPDTANSTYLNERLSSSLSLSFAFNKPMLLHKEINTIYKSPAIEYTDEKSFLEKMEDCLNPLNYSYRKLLIEGKRFKQILAEHNRNILLKYFN